MLNRDNTYITNPGLSKTILQDNKQYMNNSTNCDDFYDRTGANINVNMNINIEDKYEDYPMKLDNKDLVNILNYQSINTPLDKRIKMDFQKQQTIIPFSIQKDVPEMSNVTHISSPLSDEEFVVPLQISKTSTDLYPHLKKTKSKRRKSHVTRKIYKKIKSSSKSSSKSKRNPKKNKRNNPISIGYLL